MPTPAQIEAQCLLEREQIRGGIQQLRNNTRQLEARAYASASVYGVTMVSALLPEVIETLDNTRQQLKRAKNGPYFAEVNQYLDNIETDVIAAIGLKVFLDCVFSYRADDSTVTSLSASIGAALEGEAEMRFYEASDPNTLSYIQRSYWHRSAGTRQKQKVAKTLMRRRDVNWSPWSRSIRVRLGGWVAESICTTSGWFMKSNTMYQGKKDLTIVPTPEFLAQKDAVMRQAEDHAHFNWPMLIPPNDWGPDQSGGYLLNELRRNNRLIRGHRGSNQGCLQPTVPYGFLNRLQQVAYKLNPFTVEVAEILFERKISVGKFHPILELELPPKPLDIADNDEARKTYRREAAQVMNQNAQQIRRSSRTRSTMSLLKRFKDVPEFYLPWSFDYRGRVYPIPSFLTPQDTDFGKSLLRFVVEAEMDSKAEFWLAFQVATAYGLDKATIQERHEWVSLNNDLITRVALDPIGNLDEWANTEEPWQFLAACDEFYHCCILRDRHTTGLPVAVDATCSGLQILAGLARDQSTARLVNVLPGDTPQDAYKAVAEVAKTYLPENLAALLDRKVTKRTVMTIPYNAKPFSNRQYIRAALKDKGAEFSNDDLKLITQAVIRAMNEVVPGPMAVMRWINEEVKEALNQGKTEISWTTPSGFKVNQRLMKPNLVRVQMKLLGSCDLRVADGETSAIDKHRHKAATAPNLIHSLDASLLHIAFRDFPVPFTVIHDSVLCRATDMDLLNQRVRDTYTELFSDSDFLNEFAVQIGANTPPPIIGDFDPSAVKDSTYFFC